MGRAKELYMQHLERGFGEVPDKFVCCECFDDLGIKKFIGNNLISFECSYCQKEDTTEIAASLEDVLTHIMSSIETEWSSPEDSGTPYESKEGGWLVDPVDVWDMLGSMHPIEATHDDLFDEICNLLSDNYWLKNFPVPDPYLDQLELWDHFGYLVKHEVRYYFASTAQCHDLKSTRYLWDGPANILHSIANAALELNMFKTLKKGVSFYRARISADRTYSTASELGTAKPKFAKYANRMSPAGIPMFYCSDRVETAIDETRNGRDAAIASVGHFETLCEVLILDLTDLPELPSIYDDESRHLRTPILFMRNLIEDFSKKVEKDERVHVEYVPTQVITEYFRFGLNRQKIAEYNGWDNVSHLVGGIKYPSAAHVGGASFVFFARNDQCVDDEADKNGRFVLRDVSIIHLEKAEHASVKL